MKSLRRSSLEDKCIMGKPLLPQLITSLPVSIALSTLMAPEHNQALRQQLEEGELTYLDFDAKVFRYGPNRNHLTFYPQDLERFAASFAGQPFLRDHDTAHIQSRDGTIQVSTLEQDTFLQTIRLTTQRGMRSFLEGQIDRFSIGWYYDGIECSVCKSSWLTSSCPHWPGVSYDVNGQRVRCELIFVHPVGKET